MRRISGRLRPCQKSRLHTPCISLTPCFGPSKLARGIAQIDLSEFCQLAAQTGRSLTVDRRAACVPLLTPGISAPQREVHVVDLLQRRPRKRRPQRGWEYLAKNRDEYCVLGGVGFHLKRGFSEPSSQPVIKCHPRTHLGSSTSIQSPVSPLL